MRLSYISSVKSLFLFFRLCTLEIYDDSLTDKTPPQKVFSCAETSAFTEIYWNKRNAYSLSEMITKPIKAFIPHTGNSLLVGGRALSNRKKRQLLHYVRIVLRMQYPSAVLLLKSLE